MEVVVGKAEAHHDARDIEVLIEYRDDWDRAASSHEDRFISEDPGHCCCCFLNKDVVRVDERRPGTVNEFELGGHARGTDARDGRTHLLDHFFGALIVNEPQADFRDRASWDYGLGTLACKTAADTV